MGADVVKELTIRLNLQAGDIDSIPDYAKAKGEAAKFYEEIEKGSAKAAANVEELADITDKHFGNIEKLFGKISNTDLATLFNLGPEAADGLARLDQNLEGLADELLTASEAAKSFEEVEPLFERLAEAITNAFGEDNLSPAIIEDFKSSLQASFQEMEEDARHLAEQEVRAQEEIARATENARDQVRRAFTGSLHSISQATAGAGQFLSVIRLFTGANDDLDQLARKFAEIQATVVALGAGSRALQDLDRGLEQITDAATTTQQLLAATGRSATLLEGALLAGAPAARTLQAALGPLSLVLTGISVAVVAAQLAMEVFGDDTEEQMRRAEASVESYNESIRRSNEQLREGVAAIESQAAALSTLQELQRLEGGGDLSTEDIASNLADAVKEQQSESYEKVREAFNVAQGAISDLRKQALSDARAQVAEAEREYEQARNLPSNAFRRDTRVADAASGLAQARQQLAQTEELTGIADLKRAAPGLGKTGEDFVDAIKSLEHQMREPLILARQEGIADETKLQADALRAAQGKESDIERQSRELAKKEADIREQIQNEQDLARRVELFDTERPLEQSQLNQRLTALDQSEDPAFRARQADEIRSILAQNNLATQEQLAALQKEGGSLTSGRVLDILDNNASSAEEVAKLNEELAAVEDTKRDLQQARNALNNLMQGIAEEIKGLREESEALRDQMLEVRQVQRG